LRTREETIYGKKESQGGGYTCSEDGERSEEERDGIQEDWMDDERKLAGGEVRDR
jgi:hypothetical protein